MARPLVRSALALGFAVALTRLTACVGEDAATRPGGTLADGQACALGSESCGCTSGGACDPGLSCLSERCVRVGEDGAVLTDTGVTDTGSGDALGDVRADALAEATPEAGSSVPLSVTMNGAREKPSPVVTQGVGGPGTIILNTSTGELKGSISFSGLTGSTSSAHIHQGTCAMSGGVLHAVTLTTGAKSGTITIDLTLTPAEVVLAQKSELYVNLHTDANPGGEIRGQMIPPATTDCP